ncbi:hypothetical protein [uncultured Bdellovibrio sp.]|uniref:hypothetical protein n=1 Tax=Bdellovibrio sp. HCB-162 TaxID=3394234 RepID=UPI0025E8D7F3|nr:hypothetical protein [uncultured Bdellovibrio sp.]
MKTFTHPHKKWVMTGALLAVLGFNVSFNNHSQDGIASAEFASTVAEGVVQGKIYTAKGVVPVKYIDNGEDKVLAIVPKKMTEGKVCETCGFDSISLSVKNKEDIDALNVELMKAMEKQIKAEKPAVATTAESTTEGQEGEEKIKKSPLDGIVKACSRRSDKDAELTCIKDKYLKVLADKKASKDVEAGEALDFYKTEIQARLLKQISEARKSAARNRRAYVGQDSLWRLESDESFEDSETTIKNAGDVIADLIRDVPGKYESVRRALLNAQSDILKYEAAQYRNAFTREVNSKDPSEYPYLVAERQSVGQELNYMYDVMNSKTQNAIYDAYSNDNISIDLRNQYAKYLSDFNARLMEAVTGKGDLLNGITATPTFDISGRLANPGRNAGTVVVPTTPGGISSRTGATMNATGQTILVPVQVPAGATTMPQIGIPTQNNGVSFGTIGPASAESLRMRTEIQNRFPRQ